MRKGMLEMEPFVDTHAHLIGGVDWKLMEEIAESGVLKQAWLMHCPCVSDNIPFADEDEVLECARRYPGLFIPFGFIDCRCSIIPISAVRSAGPSTTSG